MKLGEGVEVSIHCVALLTGLPEGAVLPAQAFAERFEQSPSYLVKYMKTLVKAGVLESVSGPQGGYRLGRPADQITLLDIVLAVDGAAPAFRCAEIRRCGKTPLDDSAFPKPCGINIAMLKAEEAYRAALAETRLSDLLQDYQATVDPRITVQEIAFATQHVRGIKI